MKISTQRILTTHVGSIPRPDSITTLLRARLSGQAIDEARLAKHVADAIGEVVQRQAEVGLDVVSDGEMGKTTFLAYTDERLAGFVPLKADDPNVPFSNVGGSWARRIDTRREWQAFREYYQEYLPRAMPPSAPPRYARALSRTRGTRCFREISPRSRRLCEAPGWRRPSCPPSRREWSAVARTGTTPPKNSTCSRSPRR